MLLQEDFKMIEPNVYEFKHKCGEYEVIVKTETIHLDEVLQSFHRFLKAVGFEVGDYLEAVHLKPENPEKDD